MLLLGGIGSGAMLLARVTAAVPKHVHAWNASVAPQYHDYHGLTPINASTCSMRDHSACTYCRVHAGQLPPVQWAMSVTLLAGQQMIVLCYQPAVSTAICLQLRSVCTVSPLSCSTQRKHLKQQLILAPRSAWHMR